MTKYEELRNIINRMFPDRLKLEFGSEIRSKDDDVVQYVSYDEEYGIHNWVDQDGSVFQSSLEKGDRDTLLGKPLTIADVLKALPKNCNFDFQDDNRGSKLFWTSGAKEGEFHIPFSNPVSQWPDETIEEILKLIE
ncbi:MAG: hypothetical protein M0R06_01990 [Sphaerochaeta sp.]|jgi:hypothetical protein|nr:hypothetical protein [Sphaerochaeta sp.]